jgi:hypothetical protein
MKQRIGTFLILIVCLLMKSYAQPTREAAFETLGALVGGTWTYEGTWPNGEPFKQEIVCKWGLNNQIIKVETKGVIDREAKIYGLRNEGVRAWDVDKQQMKFFEFDVFGGVTEGCCVFEFDRFHYEYYYQVAGKRELFRDTWRKIDKDTYEFSVNMKVEDGWKVYTTNTYKRIR